MVIQYYNIILCIKHIINNNNNMHISDSKYFSSRYVIIFLTDSIGKIMLYSNFYKY